MILIFRKLFNRSCSNVHSGIFQLLFHRPAKVISGKNESKGWPERFKVDGHPGSGNRSRFNDHLIITELGVLRSLRMDRLE